MITPRNVAEKNAKNKLTLLQLAEKLGNVSKACKHMDYSRSQFYEIRRRFDLEGFQGLIDRPPIPKNHPKKKNRETVEKVLEVTRQYPGWGHRRIAAQLKLEDVSVCCCTVRRIWKKHNMTKRHQRWLWSEQQEGILELDEKQIKELEKLNPCLKERHMDSSKDSIEPSWMNSSGVS